MAVGICKNLKFLKYTPLYSSHLKCLKFLSRQGLFFNHYQLHNERLDGDKFSKALKNSKLDWYKTLIRAVMRCLFALLVLLFLTELWADPCQDAATGRLETSAQSKKRFLPFEEAMLKAQSAGVSSSKKYNKWQRAHRDMPSRPDQFYPEWQGWGHFLGTRPPKEEFLSFEEASAKARQAGISSMREYRKWQRGQGNMPSDPDRIYAGQWQGWRHFLGTEFLPFEEASAKARQAGISSKREYQKWQRGQGNMPFDPRQVYPDQWQSWGHFLGIEKKEDFLSFEEAMLKAQSAGVSSSKKYNKWQRAHRDMPSRPDQFYPEWQGWGHFLGTGRIMGRKEDFLSFKEAMLKARSARVSSSKKYNEWQRAYHDMPSRPDQFYPEWQGWRHFLGLLESKTSDRLKKLRTGDRLSKEQADNLYKGRRYDTF